MGKNETPKGANQPQVQNAGTGSTTPSKINSPAATTNTTAGPAGGPAGAPAPSTKPTSAPIATQPTPAQPSDAKPVPAAVSPSVKTQAASKTQPVVNNPSTVKSPAPNSPSAKSTATSPADAPQAANAGGSSVSGNTVTRDAILIIDNDPTCTSLLREVFKKYEVSYDLVFKPSFKEGLEFLSISPVKFIFLDLTLMDREFGAWVEEFKSNVTRKENASAPIIALSYNDDPERVRKIIRGGASDFIMKPIDRPLFIQKMSLLIDGNMVKQVYNFQTTTPVDIAYQATIEELSEFGITIRFNKKFELGDVAAFYSDIFKTEDRKEVIGRCYRALEHPENKEEFQMSFMFVGINQATLKQIRSWLRAEYVRKKQQAG